MGNISDDVFLFTAVMAHRMATEDKLWDQAGYNLELWFASRDAHGTAGATVRVMDPLCFVNSKVMFRFIRHNQPAFSKENHQPVRVFLYTYGRFEY